MNTTTSRPIQVSKINERWWTAVQLQGQAQLPVTVMVGGSTWQEVVASIDASKAAGIIDKDTIVIVNEDAAYRYEIVKDEWQPDGLDCQHPLCERFHANGCPEPAWRTEWVILDKHTGVRADFNHGETYKRRRDAVAALDAHLLRLEGQNGNA